MRFRLQNALFRMFEKTAFDSVSLDVTRYFDQCCRQFGDSIHSVGWYNTETQVVRFEVLSHIANLEGQHVLDLGCGLGDLYPFLLDRHISVQYEGIDLSGEMVKLAKKKFPVANIYQADFFNREITTQYDYILCSGALNYKVKNKYAYIRSVIEKMMAGASKGIAFNLLSEYSPLDMKDTQSFQYFFPEDILKIALEFSPKTACLHHYLPNDFSIYILK